MGYKGQIAKSISWMSGFRIITRFISFAKTAVLARLLTPAQFGIFGIASLVLEFLEMLTETGINIFLIQTKGSINKYIDSAWVLSILRGIIISLLIIIVSPLIAYFFKSPESLPILLLISLVPFIRGFISPSEVKFQKELQFHLEFWFRSSIYIFDVIVTLLFTFITNSVYSLVYGLIAGALLEVILSFVLIKPRPRWNVNREYFSQIFHSGKFVTAYGVFNYFAQHGDDIVLGRVMGSASLGIYRMSYTISSLPISEVTDVISKVTFPFYAKIATDKERLKAAFIKSTLFITIVASSIGTIIFFFPKEIILLLLGPKWIIGVPVLQVLSVYGVLRAISGSASALFLGMGNQKYVMNMTFVRFAVLIISIYPLIIKYGMVGAGYAALVSVLFEIPIIMYYLNKILK